MNKRIERMSAALSGCGGLLGLLTAMASDGGLPLRETLVRVAIALAALLLGEGGRALCRPSGRALRRRAAAWPARRRDKKPAPADVPCPVLRPAQWITPRAGA